MKLFIKFILWFSFLFNSSYVFANNARVIEVQEKIKGDISSFLEKFSPNTKYSVQVKVKPLRRKYDYDSSNENLPFMEFQDDLILDEWDDPKTNIYSLYGRITEARVTIYIEDKVSIENRARFKEALLQDVNLVPGRDTVVIEPITSPVLQQAFNWKEQTEVLLLGAMLIIAMVLGIGLNSLSKKIVPQKVESSGDGEDSSPVAAPVMTAAASASSSSGSKQSIGGLSGDLNIQDPSKINEVVGKKISKLLESEMFPTLSDMVILEELLQSDPSSFSYLAYEFPQDVQKSIYQLGKGEDWFKGFSDVGFPSKVVMISLDRMLRNRTIHQSEKFESLLIHTWRISSNMAGFIKTITKEQAFSILYHLPKDISIPVSRECFPGSWGSILEDRAQEKISDIDEVQRLITSALNFQPYFNYDSLQIFKNRKDLLSYLDSVEPNEEKDIYSVMGEENDLSSVRPAFFKFFELSLEDRKVVYSSFSMNDWAVACFNIGRFEKDLVLELMDDKEKYLFSHMLKTLDQNPEQTSFKVTIRQSISKFVNENFNNHNKTNHDSTLEDKQVDESVDDVA